MFTWLLGEAWAVDASTVALLAVVLWLDGWRRLTSHTIVLVRAGLGSWVVRAPWARVGPFALVAWWPPVVVPMVVGTVSAPMSSAEEFDAAVARGRSQLGLVRARVAGLRAVGVVVVVWIIFGIPLYTARFGGMGLLRGIALAFLFAVLAATLSTFALVTFGASWASAMGRSAHLLSPFSVVRAPEVVIAAALGQLDPLARVAVLLGDDRFLAWVRPLAYDALHGRMTEPLRNVPDVATLVRALPRKVLERASGHITTDVDTPHCPRCARTYRAGVATCVDCGGVALLK